MSADDVQNIYENWWMYVKAIDSKTWDVFGDTLSLRISPEFFCQILILRVWGSACMWVRLKDWYAYHANVDS